MWILAGDREKRAQKLLSRQGGCSCVTSVKLGQPEELWVSKSWYLGPVCIKGFPYSSWAAEGDLWALYGPGSVVSSRGIPEAHDNKISLNGRDSRGRHMGIFLKWVEAPAFLSSEGTLVIFRADGPLGVL